MIIRRRVVQAVAAAAGPGRGGPAGGSLPFALLSVSECAVCDSMQTEILNLNKGK